MALASDGAYSIYLDRLRPYTQYYYAVVVKIDGKEFESSISTLTTALYLSDGPVDLGLSVKWASCNLGASKPEEYGDYYAWAATETWYTEGNAQNPSETGIWKEGYEVGYELETSPYDDPYKPSSYTKYTVSPRYRTDDPVIFDLSDDAANVKLGGYWRTPTYKEYEELLNADNCSWVWTTVNGVNGYVVKSKKSGYIGNSIFLPAAGCRSGVSLYSVGSDGLYWSSVLGDITQLAHYLSFDGTISLGKVHRFNGLSIRPVMEK